MTTADQFREHALSLPGAEEGEEALEMFGNQLSKIHCGPLGFG